MRNPVQQYLERIVAECADSGGEVSSYIPELARVDPEGFALCLTTVDGQVYEVGDVQHAFSIQSISKPFTYALALHDLGTEGVEAKVGVEPSGDAFNEISLAADTGRPPNPMINAGALATSALVRGESGDERFGRALDWYGRFAGRELRVDEEVFGSELGSAHRNRAIAHLLREFGILESDPEDTLRQYVRQCSVSVTTRDLAAMAATLANGGRTPGTDAQVLDPTLVEFLLSVMLTCGMYDAAGDWASAVGMPAKSGVSGGIIGVLPGQVGIAVYSPRLDAHGTSARGVALFERMSDEMELHVMHVSRGSLSALRRSYTLEHARSARHRTEREQQVLDDVGARCHIYELQGDLLFSGAESIARRVVEDTPELAVLDFSRVSDIADISRHTLVDLRERLREEGCEAIAVDPDGVVPDASADRDADVEQAGRFFEDLSSAIEWCEGELLRRHGAEPDDRDPVQEHALVQDLSGEAARVVQEALTPRSVPEGEVVLEAGGPFAGIHLVTSGQAHALDRDEDGEPVTLVVLGPGTSFGELALGSAGVQETEVVAATDLELLVLAADDLRRITESDPAVALQVWRAIAHDATRTADRSLRRNAARMG